ncbi:DUF397 domain-containing protein [Streptomyces sp. NPDC006446]|uniref:DUF397 domain-containing protein n=1 Tax=Streptomyces sp. NPDC006446 TaxID=3154301 RepID=UPI0033A12CBE
MTLKASAADARPDWTKSSYSTADGPAFAEAAAVPDRVLVLVRDSKDPEGLRLNLTPAAWAAFRRPPDRPHNEARPAVSQ